MPVIEGPEKIETVEQLLDLLRPLPDDGVMVVFQDELPEPEEGWVEDEEDFELHVAILVGPPGTPMIHVVGKQEAAVKKMTEHVVEDILGGRINGMATKDELN